MTMRHLTIVDEGVRAPGVAVPRRLATDSQGQFRLELKDGEIRHIRIIPMDLIHGTRLSTVFDRIHPTIVLDLRKTLRFDQPGLSRHAFFNHLSRIRSTYFREPVEWPKLKAYHLSSRQSLPVRVYHEAVERWDGHIVLLVSKAEHARYLEVALNRALSEHRSDGWDIERVA